MDVVSLDGSYPFPSPRAREQSAQALASLTDGTLVLADGLAFGAMALEAEREHDRLRFVALVHHPLATETGLTREQARLLFESERRALACARGVVVTSRATVGSVEPYGVPSHRIAVIEPGTDPKPVARGSSAEAVRLLCVASLSPRKGYETLIDALAGLTDERWTLTSIGSTERDPAAARQILAKVAAAGLGARVFFPGECGEAEVDDYYDRSDVFVLPTLHEGYGMAVAEALAHGLPVVSTPTGAIGDLVGARAGILVAPGDVVALADTLRRVISDGTLRGRLAEGARAVRVTLPTWDEAVRRMAVTLESFAAG